MVNDQEPRYRLVNAHGSVVGSLFAESDGTVKLQEGTSGSDNELALTTQGALKVGEISRAIIGASATLSFNQNIPSDTFTKVEYDGVRYDDGNEFDTSTHSFTANASGKYHITANHQLRFPSAGTAFIISITVNGSRVREQTLLAEANEIVSHGVSGTVELSAGDTASIQVKHDEGSDLSLNSFDPQTFAEFIKVG